MTNPYPNFTTYYRSEVRHLLPIGPYWEVDSLGIARRFGRDLHVPARRNHLYVLRDGSEGPVKIGIAFDVTRRMKQLRSQLRKPGLHVLMSIGGSRSLEADVHARLRARRVHHEWFDLGPDPLPVVRRTIHELIYESPERQT